MFSPLSRLLLCTIVAVAGCTCEPSESPSAATTTVTSVAVPAQTVVVIVDGQTVARVASTEINERRSLAPWLPPHAKDMSAWRSLRATSHDDTRNLSVPEPASRYPDHDVVLYMDPQHGISIGVFRKAHLEPALSLVDVGRVEIGMSEAVPRAEVELQLVRGDQVRNVSLDELEKIPLTQLPPAPQQRPGAGHRSGWHVRDLVALMAKPREINTVTAHDAHGHEVIITLPLDEGVNPMVRRTRRGRLDLNVWHAGDNSSLRTLRGVVGLKLK
jgi:hypothetical protein